MACLDEPTLVAFVGGRLPSAEADEVDEHLAGCRACRDLIVYAARTTFAGGSTDRATSPRELAAPFTPSTGLDRYTITGLVGAGGQGLVYTADDTVLGRTVALKILRARGEAILDEARLVAKLNHPNIVAIHDAGATADGQLYLAMEYVGTGSLERWLASPRPVHEVLRVCIEAGRGLAAAHAAQIVHRDIKPGNILIGEDGRARVTDFGLATLGPANVGSGGTPAYMAPEQLAGQATQSSDQFSLAVTIWEALTGALPFTTGTDRAAAILAGPGSPRQALSRHVGGALRRALHPDPALRWPTVDAVIAELGRPPNQLRRRASSGVIAVGTLVIAVAAIMGDGKHSNACTNLDAELRSIWDTTKQRDIARAFERSPKPFASASHAAVVRNLDRYGQEWTAARTAACEATEVARDQSAEMLDRRNQCLDERKAAFGATIRTLTLADDAVIEHAVELTLGLPSLAPCADLAWLSERVRGPTGGADRVRVAQVVAQIAISAAQLKSGKIRDAVATATSAVSAATPIDHAPTTARAQLALGKAQAFTDPTAAEKSLLAAAQLAQRGHDDRTAAEAWIELVKIIGHGNARYDEAIRYAGFAEATAVRLGNDRELLGRLDYYRCAVFDLMARLEDAEQACASARKERGSVFGSDAPEVADVLIVEARLAIKSNRFADARKFADDAIRIREQAFGPAHPALTEAYFAQGQVASNDGRLDEADASFEHATAIAHGAYGEDTLVIAAIVSEQANLAHARGALARALELIDRSLQIRAKVQGADHPDIAMDLLERGRILADTGKLADAAPVLERALVIAERALGDAHPTVSAILQELGTLYGKLKDPKRARAELDRSIDVAAKSGDQSAIAASTSGLAEFLHAGGAPREALPLYERALASYVALVGPEHPQLIPTLTNIGIAETDLGDPKAAVPYLERAVRIEAKRTGEQSQQLVNPLTALGDAQFATGNKAAARATWERALAIAVGLHMTDEARDLQRSLAKLH